MAIRERIKEVRKHLQYSQAGFADAVGASYSIVQAWERGNSIPGGKILAEMHAKLGIDINWLLSGERAELGENRHRTPGGASIAGDGDTGLPLSSPLDTAAMEAVITSVLIEEAGLSPGKFAQIIATLYRDYVESGKIDEEKLRWMVRLAR